MTGVEVYFGVEVGVQVLIRVGVRGQDSKGVWDEVHAWGKGSRTMFMVRVWSRGLDSIIKVGIHVLGIKAWDQDQVSRLRSITTVVIQVKVKG